MKKRRREDVPEEAPAAKKQRQKVFETKRYGDLNQDDFFTDHFEGVSGYVHVIAVFDGHGQKGEVASRVAKEVMKPYLREELVKKSKYTQREQEQILHEAFKRSHEAIIEQYPLLTTIKDMDGVLYTLEEGSHGQNHYCNDNCVYLQDFGTTAVVVIYFEATRTMAVASVGDSHAIVGGLKRRHDSMGPTDDWQYAVRVLNPSDNCSGGLQSELKRIKQTYHNRAAIDEGYLHPINSDYEWHRLAMTRALGHKYLLECGVIWEPHITHHVVLPEDMMLVVASDGLWDVLDHEEVVERVLQYKRLDLNLTKSSECLIDEALKLWALDMPEEDEEEYETLDEDENKTGENTVSTTAKRRAESKSDNELADKVEVEDEEEEESAGSNADNTTVVIVRLQAPKMFDEVFSEAFSQPSD